MKEYCVTNMLLVFFPPPPPLPPPATDDAARKKQVPTLKTSRFSGYPEKITAIWTFRGYILHC